jgi:EIX receptor 1/2
MQNLIVLNLANNNLSERIFDSIGGICDYGGTPQTLHLQNNNFIGELPQSLMNCSSLRVLDLGENKLSERILAWIGTSLPHLVVLRLPSNLFIGRMPLQLCHLTSLQILDLSHNNITGTLPLCLGNFTAMAQKQNLDVSIIYSYTSVQNIDEFSSSNSNYFDHILVIIKGKYLEYKKTLGLVKIIDISSNKLKGEILEKYQVSLD